MPLNRELPERTVSFLRLAVGDDRELGRKRVPSSISVFVIAGCMAGRRLPSRPETMCSVTLPHRGFSPGMSYSSPLWPCFSKYEKSPDIADLNIFFSKLPAISCCA